MVLQIVGFIRRGQAKSGRRIDINESIASFQIATSVAEGKSPTICPRRKRAVHPNVHGKIYYPDSMTKRGRGSIVNLVLVCLSFRAYFLAVYTMERHTLFLVFVELILHLIC